MHETHWNGNEPEHTPDPAEIPAEAAPPPPIEGATEPSDAEPSEEASPRASGKFGSKLRPMFAGVTSRVRATSARLPLKTEVRVGLAALVSFSILVVVLIVNRSHSPRKSAAEESTAQSGSVKPEKSEPPISKPLASLPAKKVTVTVRPKAVEPRVETPPRPSSRIRKPEPKPNPVAQIPPRPSAPATTPETDDEMVEVPPFSETPAETTETDVPEMVPTPSTLTTSADEPEKPDEPTTETAPDKEPTVPSEPTALVGNEPKPSEPEPASPEPTKELEPTPTTPLPPLDGMTSVSPTVTVAEEPPTNIEAPASPATPEVSPAPSLLANTPPPAAPAPETPMPANVAPEPAPVPEPSTLANLSPVPAPVPEESPQPAESDAGRFEPLPLSNTPLSADAGAARMPRAAALPPAVVPPESTKSRDDAIEPVTHVVQTGENFWTISRLYYGSGRFYKALWAANQDQVSAPDRLFVGTTIKVPPPERLDRSRIDPATSGQVAIPKPKKASLPPVREAADEIMLLPRGRSSPEPAPVAIPKPEKTYPYHVVKRHETLRSIARDLLDDPRRATEIHDLNLDQLDDDGLQIGQRLRLPEDAAVRR